MTFATKYFMDSMPRKDCKIKIFLWKTMKKKPIMNDNQWTIGMRRYYGYKKINKYNKKD